MSFTTLMYHEIREQSMLQPDQPSPIKVRQNYEDNLPSPLFVSLEHFEEQMAYLYENKYHTLTLAQLIEHYYHGTELPEKSVLLTFDDCYQSVERYAYPLLQKYQFHAVAFVVTGWLNSARESFQPEQSVCLTEDDLRKMSDVFEYANHTDLFHTRTGTSVSLMMEVDDQELSDDLDRCNANQIIQAKNVFAYPFGLFTERNVELLRQKGFQLAFTSDAGKNLPDTDPLLLHRNAIPYFVDLETFRGMVD
ncbi:MAG: Chitin deacetylase [Firmicutes bacterium]|nr:Chitin deacetylase [Bacillota bacterium]